MHRFRKALTAFHLLWLIAGCAVPGSTVEPTQDAALLADAEQYASQYGIEVDEAMRRLAVQAEIGELNAALEEQEKDTFSGLWLEHQPEFRMVAAFTGDGEQTIQPYLEGKSYADLVDVRTFPYTLAELIGMQDEITQAAQGQGISITSGVDVTENRVHIEVANPELFRQTLAGAGVELSEAVEVVAFDPGNIPDDPRGSVETFPGPDGTTIYLPMQAPTNVYMEALYQGRLILDENGCLRGEAQDGDALLIIWHSGFDIRVDGDVIEVLNAQDQVVARVGEDLTMGGGMAEPANLPGYPIEDCPGPTWILGQIDPLEE